MSRLFREEESLASLSYPRSPYYLMSGYTPGGPYGAEQGLSDRAAGAQSELSAETKAAALATGQQPQAKKGGGWDWLAPVGGGLASAFVGWYGVRASERQGQQQMELNTYAQSRQGIINANMSSKLAQIEAEKSRFVPVYLATGIVGITIVALTLKQMAR